MYHGDISLEGILDFHFPTVDTSGVPTTLAGGPSLRAYVGNSLVEITAGLTLDVNFDGVVGSHHVRVQASAFLGYAAGTDVTLKIAAGTVGGASVVGYIVGSFSIENRGVSISKAVWEVLEDSYNHVPESMGQRKTIAQSLVQSSYTTLGVAGAGLTDLGGMSATMKAQVNAELDAALDETVADSIPVDGVRPSVRQALYMLTQFMLERGVSASTVTVRKPDGGTVLFTLSLSDPTSPTSITRAT